MKTTCHRDTHAKMYAKLKRKGRIRRINGKKLKVASPEVKIIQYHLRSVVRNAEVQKQPIYNTLKARKLKELGEEGDK